MRIALNDASTERLLAFMASRGITNPTHGLNVLITEATRTSLIPLIEDAHDNRNTPEQTA